MILQIDTSSEIKTNNDNFLIFDYIFKWDLTEYKGTWKDLSLTTQFQ